MRKLIIVAALALISTSAHAKVHDINFGGRHMRIEVPKNCKKISCIHMSEKEKSSGRARRTTEPETASPATTTAGPVAAVAAVPQSVPTSAAPRNEPKADAQPTAADDRKPVARLSLPTTAESKPAATQVAANDPNVEPVNPAEPSPLGLWLTEKGEGKVRIEECGQALCGHTEGKPNEKILINMQPSQKNRWNGKVHDIRSGGTYMAHIALRNPNSLRVEGCAFGGLFCGGQTWSRVQ